MNHSSSPSETIESLHEEELSDVNGGLALSPTRFGCLACTSGTFRPILKDQLINPIINQVRLV
ncbi:MAG: hypothetical protein ACK5FE_04065 [Cyanobacteriota bacterium]|jgi:hypothetical protein